MFQHISCHKKIACILKALLLESFQHVPVYTVQQQAVGGSSSASHVVPISTTVPQLTAYASQPITVAAPPVVTAPATGESGGGGGGGKVTGIPLQLPGLILQTGVHVCLHASFFIFPNCRMGLLFIYVALVLLLSRKLQQERICDLKTLFCHCSQNF